MAVRIKAKKGGQSNVITNYNYRLVKRRFFDHEVY